MQEVRDSLAEDTREIFFEAMMKGYAAQAPTVNFAGLEGIQFPMPYRQGPWVVTDGYFVGGQGKSGGTTLITYKGQPIWFMQYNGTYQKDALPMLKKSLLAAYEKKEFVGGRGPRLHKFDGGSSKLVYTNTPAFADPHQKRGLFSFELFAGREEVMRFPNGADQTGESLGYHEYRGELLI